MSDIKCPFCQQEMRRTNGTHNKVGVWQCQNSNDPDNVCIASGYLFNDDVLNYITRTRKALDVAVDALKEINDRYESEEQRGREEDDSPDWWDFSMDTGEILAKAIEQITALEQKDYFADVSKMIEQKDAK